MWAVRPHNQPHLPHGRKLGRCGSSAKPFSPSCGWCSAEVTKPHQIGPLAPHITWREIYLIFGISEGIEVEKQHFFFTFSPAFGAKLAGVNSFCEPVCRVTDRGHHS